MSIELVALDLDGTLLGKDGRVSRRNAEAIARVRARGIGVILATGKTRWSAVDVIAELGLSLPGVFSQGLIVCAADGGILREITLDCRLADGVLAYLEEERLPHIAYNRDGLLTPFADPYHACISGKYDEPAPRVIGPLAGRAQELRINKLLVGDKHDLRARRVDLERRFGQELTALQAVPEYVEIMPQGVSKGDGVRWLLERLGIAPQAMLAMGDGENDIEMLEMAGVGVAVGNAARAVQATADAVVSSNDDAGVAEALERFVLSGG